MTQSPAWPDISPARRNIMRANKSKNTKPEKTVRRILHALGYRFKIHASGLPGTPDIVFSKRRKVIQVYGCFWHQHKGCRHGRLPTKRQEYWITKLERNINRDIQCEQSLNLLGWSVLVIWECELVEQFALVQKIIKFLGSPKI